MTPTLGTSPLLFNPTPWFAVAAGVPDARAELGVVHPDLLRAQATARAPSGSKA